MKWEIEYTDQFGAWWDRLSVADQEAITIAVNVLIQRGPALGRPLVDTLQHSRHANMKELRPAASTIRILFAFDPRRMAILLIGGDKAGEWTTWYQRMIPIADNLYDAHLIALREEGF